MHTRCRIIGVQARLLNLAAVVRMMQSEKAMACLGNVSVFRSV